MTTFAAGAGNPFATPATGGFSSSAPAAAPDYGRERSAVRWAAALPLALLMAFGDGVWLIASRNAFGAIERTQQPFAHWLRESSVTAPVFLVAVLCALGVAARWYPARNGRRWSTLRTAAMVVAAGTFVGVLEVALSLAYDFRLQATQLQATTAMHGTCSANCLPPTTQATLSAQLVALIYMAGLILVTNLVAVAWVTAMAGGRLTTGRGWPARRGSASAGHGSALTRFESVTSRLLRPVTGTFRLTSGRTRSSGRAGSPSSRPGSPASWIDRAGLPRCLVIGGLLGAAAVHAAVVPDHLAEWPAAGLFFGLLTAGEVGVSGLLLTRVDRPVLAGAAVSAAGPMLIWLMSRTTGLPLGRAPWDREAVGLPDSAALVLETLALVGACLLARRGSTHQAAFRAFPASAVRPAAVARHVPGEPASPYLRAAALVAVLALTAIGVVGAAPSWVDGFQGSSSDHAPVSSSG